MFTTALVLVVGLGSLGRGSEVVGWGSQKLPNEPLSGITSIAAGYVHSLALKSDGSIVGWGWNYYGQATCLPEKLRPACQ